MKTKRKMEMINKTKSWLSEMVNKIDKPLPKLIKNKRERIRASKVMNEKGKLQP